MRPAKFHPRPPTSGPRSKRGQQARAAEENAEIEGLVAVSAAQLDIAPGRAILSAFEANQRRDDIGTRTAVHRAIATEPRR